MVRDAVRRFIEAEVVPNIDALEYGDMAPYEIIRKLYATFGMDQLARDRFKAQLSRKVAERNGSGCDEEGEGDGEDRASGPLRRRWGGGPDPHTDHRNVRLLPGHRDRHGRERGLGSRNRHEGRDAGPDGAMGFRPC